MKEAEGAESWSSRRYRIALVLAALAILAYLPSLGLPLISDDYGQVHTAREYIARSGWRDLASDVLYRCRTTSLVLTYWTDQAFGMSALAFRLSSLTLHVLDVLLIFALGAWKRIGWKYSAVAAGFFAVYEGHQEAVMWYAAVHELVHLAFALLCVHAWLRWLESKRFKYLAASFASYILALYSKESAIALVPLLVLLAAVERAKWWRVLTASLPFAFVALAYFLVIYAHRATHVHFNDVGTFSLQAPFWITWRNSMGRLFWIWGWLSVLALLAWRARDKLRLALTGGLWASIALLPYCFLTYMPRVPSRHTYFASAGLALVVSAGFWAVCERFHARPWLGYALASVIVVQSCAYLWIRKQAQFLERAAPTEQVVLFAAGVDGPVYLHCFPDGMELAQWAVELRLHKQAYPMVSERPLAEIQDRSNIFCWKPREHWNRASQARSSNPSRSQGSLTAVSSPLLTR